jgi:hypothetical protein
MLIKPCLVNSKSAKKAVTISGFDLFCGSNTLPNTKLALARSTPVISLSFEIKDTFSFSIILFILISVVLLYFCLFASSSLLKTSNRPGPSTSFL